MNEFIEAARAEFEARLKAFRRALMKDMIRDAQGLPSVEQELGWRVSFRGAEGGKD